MRRKDVHGWDEGAHFPQTFPAWPAVGIQVAKNAVKSFEHQYKIDALGHYRRYPVV